MFTVQGRKVRKKKRRQCDLADLWLFAECSAKELERLASLGTRIGVSAGRMLIERGTRGAEVLVVLTGSARCFVNGTEIARFQASGVPDARASATATSALRPIVST